MAYKFRAYCGICKEPSSWFGDAGEARAWRKLHFDKEHPDNPMKKENCHVQRYPEEDI